MNRTDFISRCLLLPLLCGICALVAHADIPVKRMSQLLATLKEEPDNIEALIQAGQIYLDLCDYDGSKRMAGRLEDIACRYPDSISALYYAKLLNGCTYAMSGNSKDAIAQLRQALIVAENNSMPLEQAKADNILGFCYINYDIDFCQGLEIFNEALKAAHESGSQQMVAAVLNNLTDAYLWRHDFSGMRFAEEALKISRNIGDSYGTLISLLNIAHITCYYDDLGDNIPDMLRKARDIQSQYGHVPDGEIVLVEGRYLMSRGDYKGAVELFDKAIDGGSSVVPPLLHVRMLLYKGWAQTMEQKYAEAIDAYNETLSMIYSTGYKAYRLQTLSGMAYCYEKMGDYVNALDFLKQYQHSMDSLWITEQGTVLNRYRIENEALLNRTTLERQQNELDTRYRSIIVLFIIGGVLLGVICLLWYFYRRKEMLVRSIVAREKESILRERLLRQALEQARAESAMAEKNTSTVIGEEKMEDIMVRFNELMAERRAYTDSSISIKSVAEELHTNRTYLSQAINRTFGKSFPQVLAEYRVRAAIEMMGNPQCDLPLKAIAAEVGFSSSSVFFTTFRNIVGMTPAAYRNNQDKMSTETHGVGL